MGQLVCRERAFVCSRRVSLSLIYMASCALTALQLLNAIYHRLDAGIVGSASPLHSHVSRPWTLLLSVDIGEVTSHNL